MPQARAADEEKPRDTENGRFVQTVSHEAILEYLAANELVGTVDVADRFDRTRPTAYRHLKALEDDGEVKRQTVGGSLIWSIKENEE